MVAKGSLGRPWFGSSGDRLPAPLHVTFQGKGPEIWIFGQECENTSLSAVVYLKL